MAHMHTILAADPAVELAAARTKVIQIKERLAAMKKHHASEQNHVSKVRLGALILAWESQLKTATATLAKLNAA